MVFLISNFKFISDKDALDPKYQGIISTEPDVLVEAKEADDVSVEAGFGRLSRRSGLEVSDAVKIAIIVPLLGLGLVKK